MPAPAKPASLVGVALAGWIVMVLLIWAGAWGDTAWELHERRRQGDPVHFVARLDANGERLLRSALQRNAGDAILVRSDGAVPTPARQVFSRLHAPIADDAIAVALVPSGEGFRQGAQGGAALSAASCAGVPTFSQRPS